MLPNFMNHYVDKKIEVSNPLAAAIVILIALLVIITLSLHKEKTSFLDIKSSLAFRGLAILCLLLGHLSLKALDKPVFVTAGGYYAVIIFLFLSGFGTTKKYGLKKLDSKFWRNRLSKLILPLWFSLCLFIYLDYSLLDLKQPFYRLLLNFAGFHVADDAWVNSPTWFITLLLYMYSLFYLTSQFAISSSKKVVVLSLLTLTTFIFIQATPMKNLLGLEYWLSYLFVFPAAVVISHYQKKLDFLRKRSKKNIIVNILIIAAGVLIVILGTKHKYFDLFFKPVIFVLIILAAAMLIERIGLQSKLLEFLGKYSYEIFLLHYPFMMRYDFILFRNSIYFSFFIYMLFIVGLSVILSKLCSSINAAVFTRSCFAKPEAHT